MLLNLTAEKLPEALYLSETVRQGEKRVAKALGIPMYDLMERAGESVFSVVETRFKQCRHILVVTGTGNNGGDGYVVARLALKSGYKVTLWQVGSAVKITGDAKTAEQRFLAEGGCILSSADYVDSSVDLVIDGMLGTGLKGAVRDDVASVTRILNNTELPIVSIDAPSGLNTDTGRALGETIRSAITVTFIAMKQGLVTGQARRYVGELLFAGLSVDSEFADSYEADSLLTNEGWLSALKERSQDSHKGTHGRLLIVGGGDGISGAAYLAAAASLRTGTGLTALTVHDSSCLPVRSLLPEAMVSQTSELLSRLKWCSTICLGVGLGRLDWGQDVYQTVMKEAHATPKVIDADGLYWLAKKRCEVCLIENTVITPHPGEAAMLLDCSVTEVEDNRYRAVNQLCQKYQCVTVLKGAGTLVSDGKKTVVCHAGNAGMATGGMGDVLAGVISSLLAQGYQPFDAATLGTLIHSMAADHNAERHGQVGLIASDVLGSLRYIINGLGSQF